MTGWTAIHQTRVLPRRAPRTLAPCNVSQGRRGLATTLEIALEPHHAVRRGLRTWPRIPPANLMAIAEPLREIVSSLRDPEIDVPKSALPHVLAFVSSPASPAFGPHPTRAMFAAYALADELRA
jgi:hypothetical protein